MANQTQNLAAVLQNMDHVTKAYDLAINSAGSAMAENEKAVASLEGQTNLLKAEFQDLANNVITNELISAVLKLTKALLSLLNTGVGQFITRFGLVSATTLGFTTMVVQLGSKALPLLKAAFVSTGAAAGTAAVGVTALQAALGWVSLAIGAIVAVAPLIIDAWKDSHKSIEDLSSELKGLNDELGTNKARIEEIQSMSWNNVTSDIIQEYYALLKQNEELERNIKLKQTEIREKAETGKIAVGVGYTVSYARAAGSFSHKSDVFDTYEEALAEMERLQKEYTYVWEPKSVTVYAKGIADVIPIMENYNSVLEENGELSETQNEDFVELMASAGNYYNSLKQLKDAGVVLNSQEQQFIQTYEAVNKKYRDGADALQNFGISMKQVKDKFPDLYEYFSDTGFSIESFGKYCKGAKVDVDSLAGSLYDLKIASANLEVFDAKESYNKLGIGMAGLSKYKPYLEARRKYEELVAGKADFISQIKSAAGITKNTGTSGNDDGKKDLTAAQKRLEKFNEALKLLDHQLAMDQISTEEYYVSLQKLMDTYLQDAENQETLWKYQEKIYSWKKKAAEDEQSAQEKINSELQKQIELQEKLRDAAEALAKAQQKRILVFRKSGYGYMQDVGAISEAQAAYAKVKSGYAGGTVYSSAGLHMFGENGPELGVIGSGNGVLPSEITRNLWEWGAQRPEEMLASVPASGGDTISFSGVTMAFPNVRSGNDAQGFMESLVMLARQRAYKRY